MLTPSENDVTEGLTMQAFLTILLIQGGVIVAVAACLAAFVIGSAAYALGKF